MKVHFKHTRGAGTNNREGRFLRNPTHQVELIVGNTPGTINLNFNTFSSGSTEQSTVRMVPLIQGQYQKRLSEDVEAYTPMSESGLFTNSVFERQSSLLKQSSLLRAVEAELELSPQRCGVPPTLSDMIRKKNSKKSLYKRKGKMKKRVKGIVRPRNQITKKLIHDYGVMTETVLNKTYAEVHFAGILPSVWISQVNRCPPPVEFSVATDFLRLLQKFTPTNVKHVEINSLGSIPGYGTVRSIGTRANIENQGKKFSSYFVLDRWTASPSFYEGSPTFGDYIVPIHVNKNCVRPWLVFGSRLTHITSFNTLLKKIAGDKPLFQMVSNHFNALCMGLFNMTGDKVKQLSIPPRNISKVKRFRQVRVRQSNNKMRRLLKWRCMFLGVGLSIYKRFCIKLSHRDILGYVSFLIEVISRLGHQDNAILVADLCELCTCHQSELRRTCVWVENSGVRFPLIDNKYYETLGM